MDHPHSGRQRHSRCLKRRWHGGHCVLAVPVAVAENAPTPCCIQRHEQRSMSALDVQANVILTVRRLRCMSHGQAGAQACSFSMAHPAIMVQLTKQGLQVAPLIISLNPQTIVTGAAYQCAPCFLGAFLLGQASHQLLLVTQRWCGATFAVA
jgi:hypothetical protein